MARIGELGELGKGEIEPGKNNTQVDSLINELSTSPEGFLLETDKSIVTSCIDGRITKTDYNPGPKTAGGSLSLLVAYWLCGGEMRADNFFDKLSKNDLPISGHVDDHSHHDGKTGCGANDKMSEILDKLSDIKTSDMIFQLVEKLSRISDESVFDMIQQNSRTLLKSDSVVGTPRERMAALAKNINKTLPELTGEHDEAVIIVNTQPYTMIDINRIKEKYRNSAFVIDFWAFKETSDKVIRVLNEKQQIHPQDFMVAMLAYNLATGSALAGPSMEIIII